MTFWLFLAVIVVAWLTYPLAGAVSVAAESREGKRPANAGFSFLPELIIFPLALAAVAAIVDFLARPWGSRIVGGLCVVMIFHHTFVIVRSLRKLRRLSQSHSLPPDDETGGRG
ncbi:MAG TPA: hypothetical protein VK968_11240 [Roseimicrobium sp.]|nr:hypothetical protein [Roseimicrobium sp.]